MVGGDIGHGQDGFGINGVRDEETADERSGDVENERTTFSEIRTVL